MFKVSAFLGLLLAAVTAQAGLRVSYPLTVYVDSEGGYLNGALSDVRASAGTDWIECWTQSSAGYRWAQCTASTSQALVACWTTDPAMLATFDALHSDAILSLRWGRDGACTKVNIVKGSHIRPKTL
jgi:hypothetical protein